MEAVSFEEEKRKGVDCVIDAVGYQAHDDEAPSKGKPTQVLENCLRVVNSTGNLAIIGVYLAPDPGAKGAENKQGISPIGVAQVFDKSLSIGNGLAPVKRYDEYLRDLIISGRARPGKLSAITFPSTRFPKPTRNSTGGPAAKSMS
jgi:glutathione-independent formaldehyde dehydrogenase